jgi:hypothetical protein
MIFWRAGNCLYRQTGGLPRGAGRNSHEPSKTPRRAGIAQKSDNACPSCSRGERKLIVLQRFSLP